MLARKKQGAAIKIRLGRRGSVDIEEGIMTDQIEERPPMNSRYGYKRGWRKVGKAPYRMDVLSRLEQLAESETASDEVKKQANQFLSEIVGGRMPTVSYDNAHKLIKANFSHFNIRKIKQFHAKQEATSHAIFLACQACDNLRDQEIMINSQSERRKIIGQIASAINALSEVQSQLIEGNND
jgi:hypothetical protein